MDYLVNFEMKPSNFYGLPKVHKSEKIKTTYEQNISHHVEVHYINDLKLRPIVAGPTCQTHRLRPLTKRMKSYLRDTTDFLNHLPSEISENTLLVSFDVQSLYSNIPHHFSEKAINYWLGKFPNDCPARFPKEFI